MTLFSNDCYHPNNNTSAVLMNGDIAQLGERGVRNAEVGGSSPPISTNSIKTVI